MSTPPLQSSLVRRESLMLFCCKMFDWRVIPRWPNVTVGSQFQPAESAYTCANLEVNPAGHRSFGSQRPAFVIAWVVIEGAQ